ncbi:MAG TPA: hypothetical protein VFV65_07780 [Gemmatimonadales bacterium]|nr:hypothetical protein [Gemmatimonadales bacterium]
MGRQESSNLIHGPENDISVEPSVGARLSSARPPLREVPPSNMCRPTTRVTEAGGVDAQVRKWIEVSFNEAG